MESMATATTPQGKDGHMTFCMLNTNTGQVVHVDATWDTINASHNWVDGWSLRYVMSGPVEPLVVIR